MKNNRGTINGDAAEEVSSDGGEEDVGNDEGKGRSDPVEVGGLVEE